MSEEQEQLYVSLVRESWKRYDEVYYNMRMDDLLVGGVITAMVEAGYGLIDLVSDGTNHNLRFENFASRERLIFQLTNLAENLIAAKVLGRHARVIIGYGRPVKNAGALWQAAKSEFKSAFLDATEPGVITVDADVSAGYIYVQVPLILGLDPYLSANYGVNYGVLQQHIMATVASLAKYLNGRFGQ